MLNLQPNEVSKNREVKILFLHLIKKTKDYYVTDFWRDAEKEFHKRLAQLFIQLKGGRRK